MMASAEGYLRLNYGLVGSVLSTIQTGAKNLWEAQKLLAKRIDEENWRRYGFEDTFEPRSKECVSRPMPSKPLPISALALVRSARDRASLISQIGVPYCQLVSGADLWLVQNGKVFRVEYGASGVEAQILDPDSLAKIDARPTKIPEKLRRSSDHDLR